MITVTYRGATDKERQRQWNAVPIDMSFSQWGTKHLFIRFLVLFAENKRLKMFPFSHTCLHTHPPKYILAARPAYLPNYLSVCPPTYLSIFPTYQHTSLPPYLPSYLPTYLPTYRPACLPAYLPTYLPTCPPINLPTHTPT